MIIKYVIPCLDLIVPRARPDVIIEIRIDTTNDEDDQDDCWEDVEDSEDEEKENEPPRKRRSSGQYKEWKDLGNKRKNQITEELYQGVIKLAEEKDISPELVVEHLAKR